LMLGFLIIGPSVRDAMEAFSSTCSPNPHNTISWPLPHAIIEQPLSTATRSSGSLHHKFRVIGILQSLEQRNRDKKGAPDGFWRIQQLLLYSRQSIWSSCKEPGGCRNPADPPRPVYNQHTNTRWSCKCSCHMSVDELSQFQGYWHPHLECVDHPAECGSRFYQSSRQQWRSSSRFPGTLTC
jgi:hypothetical protein